MNATLTLARPFRFISHRLRQAWRRWWYANLYLRTPHWKRVRRRALQAADHRCITCRSTNRLQVHHLAYYRGGKSILWHERMSDLAVLCEACHARTHRKENKHA